MENKKITQVEKMDGIKHLWYWRKGGQSFQCSFFRLVAKADKRNRKHLAMGYPHLVEVYSMWDEAEDEDEFFKFHGLDSVKK